MNHPAPCPYPVSNCTCNVRGGILGPHTASEISIQSPPLGVAARQKRDLEMAGEAVGRLINAHWPDKEKATQIIADVMSFISAPSEGRQEKIREMQAKHEHSQRVMKALQDTLGEQGERAEKAEAEIGRLLDRDSAEVENLKAENQRLKDALDILKGGKEWADDVQDAMMKGYVAENQRLTEKLEAIAKAAIAERNKPDESTEIERFKDRVINQFVDYLGVVSPDNRYHCRLCDAFWDGALGFNEPTRHRPPCVLSSAPTENKPDEGPCPKQP